ncbi:MAG: pseudouridine synthase [Parafilimonas sp.]
MKQYSFDKFINTEKNSKKKEAIRQEKRKWKDEKEKKQETIVSRSKSQHSTSETRNPKFEKSEYLKNARSKNTHTNKTESFKAATSDKQSTSAMPLNKFIAYAGICGRREAADLVKQGKVKVNNDVVYEPGFKVGANDKIIFNNKQLHVQKNLVYILLNKPKDYITTAKDTQGRKTVFDIIATATTERVFSVGRLDRNTTGVLLLTNDGELTQKLTHPSFEIKKIYEVKLDKPVQKKDMESILNGIELEDGFIAADSVGYSDKKDPSVVGIEIHSGKNRIVRRIFEKLGYDVKNLDRVLFANLTKKNVDRGKWRFLNEKEIRLLKYMNQSFIKKKAEPALGED